MVTKRGEMICSGKGDGVNVKKSRLLITTTPGLCLLHDCGLCWIQHVAFYHTMYQNETAVPYQSPGEQWLSK